MKYAKSSKKQYMMRSSEEIQVIDSYQSVNVYKAIRTPVNHRAIIYRCRKHGAVVNLPWSGRLPKSLEEHIDISSTRSKRNPEQDLKNCRPSLASEMVRVRQ
ncbi:hypothetical protein ATANTOWER_013366 [Ataeniobius toweri]|uniref:Uncharacterized protein n=1 Tax=Ataeniobius toweri TaxID=208326 RepID=A0ABU7BQ07_9TELE|nr:hypothetical protein [Ataeniobius toweri]